MSMPDISAPLHYAAARYADKTRCATPSAAFLGHGLNTYIERWPDEGTPAFRHTPQMTLAGRKPAPPGTISAARHQ